MLAVMALPGEVAVSPARAAGGEQPSVHDVMKGIVENYERSTKQRLDRARQRLGAPPPRDATSPTPQSAPRQPPGKTATIKDCPDCPELRVVPAGTFTIGSPPAERERNADEAQRFVRIKQPFALGTREVSAREFAVFLSEAGYQAKGDCFHWHDRHLPHDRRQTAEPLDWPDDPDDASPIVPATCIGWNDAIAYVQWLAKRTGQPYRLPSEAEWEYAARAGTTTPYWWGTSISPANAVYDRPERVSFNSEPSKEDRPNAWGFHHMNGNVWEWTQDCYQPRYPTKISSGAANDRPACSQRVGRGGSWGNAPGDLRTANRLKAPTAYRSTLFGFRIARSL